MPVPSESMFDHTITCRWHERRLRWHESSHSCCVVAAQQLDRYSMHGHVIRGSFHTNNSYMNTLIIATFCSAHDKHDSLRPSCRRIALNSASGISTLWCRTFHTPNSVTGASIMLCDMLYCICWLPNNDMSVKLKACRSGNVTSRPSGRLVSGCVNACKLYE